MNTDYHINTIISNDDITVNYDKWKNGEINKLFILGLMGASKSITCRRLTKKYNCKFVEFDIFRGQVWYTDKELQKQHPLIYEYFKTIYEPKYGSRMNIKDIKGGNIDLLTPRQKEFLYWVLEKQERIIIEGLISKFIEDDEQLMSYPMILIGTSKLTSESRMMKRQISYQIHNWRNGFYDLGEIKNMIKMLSRYESEQEIQNRVREKIITQSNGTYEPLHEDYHINMLMSNKDVYIRFDKFRTDEINKLLIQGLSGSGKSTLARELSKKYNCPCIELDKFRGNIYYTDEELKINHPYIYRYFKIEFTKGDRHNIAKMEPEDRREEFEKFVYWLLKQPERMVIEGALERILYMDDDIRKTYPMVFKGTSMLKSMARMSWREFHRDHPGRDSIDNLLWWMKWCTKYKKMTDQHNNVREKIMGDVDMNDYEEREENDLPLIIEAMGYKPQPIIFSDDDIYINYDKWKSGESKTCLITAISGGGKSTLAKKIAERDNAYYVEIDVISFGLLKPQKANWEYIQENDKYLYKFLKEYNLPPTLMLQFKDAKNKRKTQIIDQYIYWLCFERDDVDKNKVVVAGSDVAASLINIKELADFPIIIKGTSIAKSAYRKIQRTLNKGHDVWFILDHILNSNYFSMYKYRVPEINQARQAVMDQEYEEIHEAVQSSFNTTTNIFPLTHKQMGEIYTQKAFNESWKPRIPHVSGNITQYSPGAYFNEEVGVWMRKPNAEEQAKLDLINESFSGYEFKPLIESKPTWDPKLWKDPGPNTRDFDIKKELKTFMYPQAIKEKYQGPNFYINLPGLSKDKRFRVRCEMIILDSEGRMLVDRKRTFKRMNLSYDNTGGGIDPGEEIVDAAAREAQEEARITVKNPIDSMLWYAYEVPEDSKRNYGYWGVASFICVGKKKSKYTGYIKKDDRDSFITRAEWLYPDEIKDLLPAHRKAIEMYKQFYLQESLGINMEFLNNEYE